MTIFSGFITVKLIETKRICDEKQLSEITNRVVSEYRMYNYSLEGLEYSLTTTDFNQIKYQAGYIGTVGGHSEYQSLESKKISLQKNMIDAMNVLENNMGDEKREDLRDIVINIREELGEAIFEPEDVRIKKIEMAIDNFNRYLATYLEKYS